MNTFAERVKAADPTLAKVADAFLKDECDKCQFLNPCAVTTYRCKVVGSCPAVSLSDPVLKRIRAVLVPVA